MVYYNNMNEYQNIANMKGNEDNESNKVSERRQQQKK